jgi:DNA polymerase I-like protein with 3'-5' exonuclease and polymerase domains/uracil-DNA glycosylase
MLSSNSLPSSTPTSGACRIDFEPTGPAPARIMIVGEAPGEKEVAARRPFVGPSGRLLDEVLREAGLARGMCFLTNVCREQPPGNDLMKSGWVAGRVKDRTPEHTILASQWVNPKVRFGLSLLEKELRLVQPTVVIALGNLALWALTGEWGITKWRSSILPLSLAGGTSTPPAATLTPAAGASASPVKVIPALHPAAVLREWPKRGLLVHDLRRARYEMEQGPGIQRPDYSYIIRPSFNAAFQWLLALYDRLEAATDPIPLAADIETRGGHTACLGIATSRTDAICIPWMCVERLEGYWLPWQEAILIRYSRLVLSHPKAEVQWQNGAYDHQYEHRWHFFQPRLGWDTMVAHHAMFSISPKALDHLSSLYCTYHRYWKDDGRLWDPGTQSEDQLWSYNCEDCVRTFEIAEEEKKAIVALTPSWPRLPEVVAFQHALQPAVVRMMLRGVRSDDISRERMRCELTTRIAEIQAEIDEVTGQPLNIRSSKQMTEFFYGTLAQTPILRRNPGGGPGTPTCDDEALLKIASREPALRALVGRIQSLRSAGVFLSTFVQMPRDIDGRLRCSYNVAGTKTYRFSSSENAFGSGGNLQNIPEGDEETAIELPNIRTLFLFDPGRTGFDLDGDQADLRIVAGDSGCRQLAAYFAAGAKVYVEIAREFYRDPSITKAHPKYRTMKSLCHGSNYGGEPKGLSERIGLPVHDVERIQKWYFGMCPEIRQWQEDTKAQFNSRGYIENAFGYRLWRWDRPSRQLDNEALAWTPQSTVGILINKILLAIDQQLPDVELLLQVHDSLTGQVPTEVFPQRKEQILSIASSVVIPCKHGPVTVPAGMKTSEVSWGECR